MKPVKWVNQTSVLLTNKTSSILINIEKSAEKPAFSYPKIHLINFIKVMKTSIDNTKVLGEIGGSFMKQFTRIVLVITMLGLSTLSLVSCSSSTAATAATTNGQITVKGVQ